MIQDLIKLANHLDSKGLTKEADALDILIKKVSNGQLSLDDGASTVSGDEWPWELNWHESLLADDDGNPLPSLDYSTSSFNPPGKPILSRDTSEDIIISLHIYNPSFSYLLCWI